jgi:membrane protease subunit (stomatin/prohibitin family)
MSNDEKRQDKDEARQEQDETISDSKKCPECGEPIENVRASCPNCGYEYKDSDYDQPDAGAEFVTGSEIDESGEEIVDESGKVESERKEEN